MISKLIEKEKYVPGSNSTSFSLQYLNCFYFVWCIQYYLNEKKIIFLSITISI